MTRQRSSGYTSARHAKVLAHTLRPEKREEIERMLRSRMTVAAVAARAGVAKSTVRNVAKKAQIDFVRDVPGPKKGNQRLRLAGLTRMPAAPEEGEAKPNYRGQAASQRWNSGWGGGW